MEDVREDIVEYKELSCIILYPTNLPFISKNTVSILFLIQKHVAPHQSSPEFLYHTTAMDGDKFNFFYEIISRILLTSISQQPPRFWGRPS